MERGFDRDRARCTASGLAAALWIGWIACGAALGQVTARVSVVTGGGQANDASNFASLSADGRYVAFESAANNLVANDFNARRDIFVRDRAIGTTKCLTAFPFGTGNDDSTRASISGNGRFVAFESLASNLVPGDTNGAQDIFVYDLQTDVRELVSVTSSGQQADGMSEFPEISSDGRFVAFTAWGSSLVAGAPPDLPQIVLRDRATGTTEPVSVDANGTPASFGAIEPAVSDDGRFVVFYSASPDLVPGDTNGKADVFLRDRLAGTTTRVSVDASGNELDGDSFSPRLSGDGRFVVFTSFADDILPGLPGGVLHVFLKDLSTGMVELVSMATDGTPGDGDSHEPFLSADGRFVSFHSLSANLVAGDTNGWEDVFLRDRIGGTTERVDLRSDGGQPSWDTDSWPSYLSDDGRFVSFASPASDFVSGDTNAAYDVFVRDRFPGAGTTAFTSFCDPSAGGVRGCPCSNPPAGAGRGCDNSDATGGASLAATGISRIEADSLVFSTAGEKAGALSIVVQGNAVLPGGAVYGQGVRCVGGRSLRLYVKSAIGGSITAPEFSLGDAPVSVRSRGKGDTILGGESRWYAVYYRDATVLGGCPATSTFTATQAGEIAWAY